MHRITKLAAVLSVSVLALVWALVRAPQTRAAPETPAAGLVTIGCEDTPVDLGNGATISRTCASWDGENAAFWVEGANLAQEFTAVGSATFNILGYVITIEAEAGMRRVDGGGWEAFLALTQPFQLGPVTAPLEVAADGSKVTVWILTDRMNASATHSENVAQGSAFTLSFLDADRTLRATVNIPLGLQFGQTPPPPGPEMQPSAPATTPGPLPAGAAVPQTTSGSTPVPEPASAAPTQAPEAPEAVQVVHANGAVTRSRPPVGALQRY